MMTMQFSRRFKILSMTVIYLFTSLHFLESSEIPLGEKYHGPKCVIDVGDFGIRLKGVQENLGDGLREMLVTALIESNYFVVVDRMDIEDLTAEQLLSSSFMANPDAILNEGEVRPVELMVYGAIVAAEADGGGLRVKFPWVPMKVRGKHHHAKVMINTNMFLMLFTQQWVA